MPDRVFKERLYDSSHALAWRSAVGTSRATDLLAQGPRHVEALAAELEAPIANVSSILQRCAPLGSWRRSVRGQK